MCLGLWLCPRCGICVQIWKFHVLMTITTTMDEFERILISTTVKCQQQMKNTMI